MIDLLFDEVDGLLEVDDGLSVVAKHCLLPTPRSFIFSTNFLRVLFRSQESIISLDWLTWRYASQHEGR